MEKINYVGKRCGYLVVIKELPCVKNNKLLECRCDCGNIVTVRANNFNRQHHKSCGCHKGELISKAKSKHRLMSTRIYRIWKGLRQRCLNPNHPAYKNYGGRGITICDEWFKNFTSFYEWSMKNGYKEGLSIDRIDNNGNYCPENCRWVDEKKQANNRRSNTFITINNQTKTLSNWLEFYNMKHSTYYNRLFAGLSVIQALTKPVRYKKPSKI